MAARVDIGLIDAVQQTVRDLAQERAPRLPHHSYSDIRLEVGEGKQAVSENGAPKGASSDYGISYGIRVLAGERTVAPGYVGGEVGAAEAGDLERILWAGLEHAHARALANAVRKTATKAAFPELGASLQATALAPIPVHQATIEHEAAVDLDAIPLEEINAYVNEISRAVKASDTRLAFNFIWGLTLRARQLFVSSEGAQIDEAYALTQGMAFILGQTAEANVELYDYIGHQRGWEVLRDGVDEPYIQNPTLMEFALGLAKDIGDLVEAPRLPATDEDVIVVSDPHYNTLLVHEIVGHPTEADRALKMETAYAGRSWLFRGLDDSMVGQRIGSPLLSAYSDPSLPGYGHYQYDDEGTPAQKVVHIENGIFKGFMNSRQTAAVMGNEPNGSYKATDASLVPLIRMSNTVFAPGEDDPQELIRSVEHGYYLVGHRIPSIAESRENFRISAQKVYEIRNGEIGQLYRDGGIQADSRDFFMNIDGVGTDFRLYPIPNCGKGQPMQVKRLGNGGPTLRSRAKLTGA